MSTATTPAPSPTPPSWEPSLWPISVALYTRMAEVGILGKRDPVYLWRGRLACKAPRSRPHCVSVRRAHSALRGLPLVGCAPEQGSPIALRLERSVPEPDVVVLRGRSEDFPRDFPTSADVALAIEVADTTLARDRALAFTYAAEGIPVYWLVNLPGRRVEVFTEPAEGAYTRCTPYGPEDVIPVLLDGREVGRIAVKQLLP